MWQSTFAPFYKGFEVMYLGGHFQDTKPLRGYAYFFEKDEPSQRGIEFEIVDEDIEFFLYPNEPKISFLPFGERLNANTITEDRTMRTKATLPYPYEIYDFSAEHLIDESQVTFSFFKNNNLIGNALFNMRNLSTKEEIKKLEKAVPKLTKKQLEIYSRFPRALIALDGDPKEGELFRLCLNRFLLRARTCLSITD